MFLRILQSVAILAFAITHISPPAFANGDGKSNKGSIHFEFELSTEAVEHLEKGLAQLKLGDSVQRAKSLLGKPSDEGELYRKGVFRGTFVNKYLKYYVKLVEIDSKNLKDHVIVLYFDAGGALVKAKRLGYSKSSKAPDPNSFQIVENIL